jgi:hypothetical protein
VRARAVAAANDTIYLRGGTYFQQREHHRDQQHGSLQHRQQLTNSRLSYLAYPGERPVFFSAVQPISNRVTGSGDGERLCVQGI